MAEETQKREDELVAQAEELKCQTKVDQGTKTEVQDCFDTCLQICDEADEIHDRKSPQEEDLKQCSEKPQKQRGNQRGEKNGGSIAWQLSESNNTKGQNLELDWDSSLSLAKEN